MIKDLTLSTKPFDNKACLKLSHTATGGRFIAVSTKVFIISKSWLDSETDNKSSCIYRTKKDANSLDWSIWPYF